MDVDRRRFVSGVAAGLTSFGFADAAQGRTSPGQGTVAGGGSPSVGRPVRAVSIGFKPGLSLEKIGELVDKEGSRGADLIALPETCRGQTEKTIEAADGPTVTALARLAEKHRTYIVCPIDRMEDGRRYNSALVLDRRGRIAAIYDKLYPFWVEEFSKRPPVQPGNGVTVVQTDFGKLGLAICFDVNWGGLWQRLSDFGAELVVWPSAYSAGRSLQARATDFNYYIMSATWVPDCSVYDIDGEQLLYEAQNAGDINITRYTFDLDRCLFHQDLNLPRRLERLLKERENDVEREKWLPKEGWFILRAKRPGVSARQLAREYGLEERRPYINRSRCEVDKARGWQFD